MNPSASTGQEQLTFNRIAFAVPLIAMKRMPLGMAYNWMQTPIGLAKQQVPARVVLVLFTSAFILKPLDDAEVKKVEVCVQSFSRTPYTN